MPDEVYDKFSPHHKAVNHFWANNKFTPKVTWVKEMLELVDIIKLNSFQRMVQFVFRGPEQFKRYHYNFISTSQHEYQLLSPEEVKLNNYQIKLHEVPTYMNTKEVVKML